MNAGLKLFVISAWSPATLLLGGKKINMELRIESTVCVDFAACLLGKAMGWRCMEQCVEISQSFQNRSEF